MTSAAAEDIQLGEDAAQVAFYGELTDEEVGANFLVALAAGE